MPLRRIFADYSPGDVALVQAATLSIFRILGTHANELTIVGGFVPYLLIDQGGLQEDQVHPGTQDLDLVLQLTLLDGEGYKEVSKCLRESGFHAAEKAPGVHRLQQWIYSHDGVEVIVEFLIPPAPEDEGKFEPGKIKKLEQDFGAIVTRGAHLVRKDRILVKIEGENLRRAKDACGVWVCGPAAFLVLKAFALVGREKFKDAFDLDYVLRHFPDGLPAVLERMHPLLVDPDTQEALQILEDKFASLNHTGPMDVAAFVGDPEDDDLRQDASALILDFVKLCRGPQGRGE
jgi:hypothetical protein